MAGSFVFPTRLFEPRTFRPRPLGQAIGGGASALSGEENFADSSGGGRWVVEFGETTLWTPEKILAWRQLEAALDGGATSILVPLPERLLLPVNPVYTGADAFGLDPWVDDAAAWTADEVTAATTAAAALRATSLSFTCTAPKALLPGMQFSILHPTWGWRLYRITRITAGGLGTGDATTIQLRTPLREAVPIGAALNFDLPRFCARVDGDMSAEVELYRLGKAQARFVELPRAA